MTRAIVIGGGLAGVTTAYYLQTAGLEVELIEAKDAVGYGASYANGGLLTPSMADPWNAPGVWRDLLRYLGDENAPMLLRLHALPGLAMWGSRFLMASRRQVYERTLKKNVRLAMYSLKCLDVLREDLNLDFDSAQNGVLKIYRDREAYVRGIEKVDTIRPYGVTYDCLEGSQISEREPALTPILEELAGALYFPDDQTGNALAFVQALTEQAKVHGAKLTYTQQVTRLLTHGQAVRGVKLASGDEVSADIIVVATGANAPALVKPLGVRLPIKPVKGYSLTYTTNASTNEGRPQLAVVDDDLHAAVTPFENSLRVAGTAEFTGFDDTVSSSRIDNLRAICAALYPIYSKTLDQEAATPWTGLRPVSAVGSPIIGATKVPGLYLNTGHGPLGWTMAAGSARALADFIVHGQAHIDLDDYV